MPNKNYLRGRRLEYEVVEDFINAHPSGSWAQRMAGSHSPFDVVGVDYTNRTINFVQCKTKVGKKVGYVDSERSEDGAWTVVMYKRTKLIKKRK